MNEGRAWHSSSIIVSPFCVEFLGVIFLLCGDVPEASRVEYGLG